MSIPKHYEMYKDVLTSLENSISLSNKELADEVAKRMAISGEDRSVMYPSGNGYIFDDRVIWARTYLKAAGLIEIPRRGFSKITGEGKKVLAENPSPLDNAYLSKYDSFKVFMKPKNADVPADTGCVNESMEETPEERINAAFF